MAAPAKPLNAKALPFFEWLAENAYVSPGKHRFLTAFGLMGGLSAGHAMMNVFTGQDFDGNPVTKDQIIPPLQPFYGLLAYNINDDSDNAKWHRVADSFVPFICGAMGAMAGSTAFSRGLKVSDEIAVAANNVTKLLRADLSQGKMYLQHADMLGNREQAKLFNVFSGIGLNWGSTSGVHLVPSLFSSSTNAFRFQLDQGKNIITPWLRNITHNRGHSSRNFFTSLPHFIQYTGNAAAHMKEASWATQATKALADESSTIAKYAKDMLQVFKTVTPQQQKLVEQRLADVCLELEKVAAKTAKTHGLEGDTLVKALEAEGSEFRRLADSFTRDGLEKTFIDAGLINPANKAATMANIAAADHGIISGMLKPFGEQNKTQKHLNHWWEALQKRQRGEPVGDLTHLLPNDRAPHMKGAALVAGTIGAGALFGGIGKQNTGLVYQPNLGGIKREELAGLPRHEAAKRVHDAQDRTKDRSGIKGFINDKPLDVLDFISRVTVVPPGMHRFMNAAFLSFFLVAGTRLSCALTARGLRGEHLPINSEKIWGIFRPLYGKMAYNPASTAASDRWKRVAHQLIPVGVGAFGTYTGSRMYFGERIRNTRNAEFLEDYTDKILMDESESFAKASAITSVLNTGSGFHLIPFMGYPSHLQNRFLMAKGQQVATPILGQWWSGNPSYYPWHVKTLLNRMLSYSVENPDEFPRQLEKMSHALIAKLFPDLPQQELEGATNAFVDKLYAVRDRYWEPGGIPKTKQLACKQDLEKHFRREGLERTLLEIGLNPLQAQLDNNGAGGAFARFMGASGRVSKDITDYRKKAADRLSRTLIEPSQPDTPDTKIPHPADTLASHSRLTPQPQHAAIH